MTMRDAQPINDAFYRVDIGEGTDADFETIRKFVNELQNERARIPTLQITRYRWPQRCQRLAR